MILSEKLVHYIHNQAAKEYLKPKALFQCFMKGASKKQDKLLPTCERKLLVSSWVETIRN